MESFVSLNLTNNKIKKDELFLVHLFAFAWRRPTLTRGNPSLQSALRSLTSVFGMVTGVSFSLSPPHCGVIFY